jgi:hypothetical protein
VSELTPSNAILSCTERIPSQCKEILLNTNQMINKYKGARGSVVC